VSKKQGPGKYYDWITEEGLLKIEGWARDGLTDEQISHNIGIHPSTLYDWQKKYSEIAEALKNGKEVVDRQVENALLKRALGYEYEEVKQIIEKDEKGKDRKRIEKTIKQVIPDITAQIFWLKNRKPAEWRNKHIELETEEQKLRISKLKYEVSQLSGGNEEDTGIKDFLKAIKPADEDMKELFADEEVIEDGEETTE
jgi:transposase-like protein